MSDFYAQQCEDLIIDELLDHQRVGTYIDIGANDPVFLSNTKRFYDRGWHGINVEPNPHLYRKIVEARPRDLNMNIGIGNYGNRVPFYIYEPHQLSSFIPMTGIMNRLRNRHTKLKAVVSLRVRPLSDLPHFSHEIDFMSVDVEGNEIEVLKTNDWEERRPKLLIVEITYNERDILKYIDSIGYDLVFKNAINGIFIDNEYKDSVSKWMPRWLPGYVP